MCAGRPRRSVACPYAGVRSPADLDDTGPEHTLIDRIRHDIQERLDQLLAEAEKLRHALAALDPRERPTRGSKPERAANATERSAPGASAPSPRNRTPAARSEGSRARTAPGATKAKVLGALSVDDAMTAGEVAKATGLAPGTVSTTLSKLAKSGEVAKAERGYRLPAPS